MREVFRIKIEALNFNKVYHTIFSADLEIYPNHEYIKAFIDDYMLKFGRTTLQAQIVKFYVLK